MTQYDAYVEDSWREHGLANVMVIRRKSDSTDIGSFLVDWWCLGVKDAMLVDDVTEAEAADILDRLIPADQRERIHPACAKKLIDGALAYAENLGFAPHRDYRKARRVLSGLSSADCPETFTYGNKGRPCYFQGELDSPDRVEKVLAVLEARLGPEGYDYMGAPPMIEDDELAQDVADSLYDFIAAHPSPAFGTFSEFSGLVTSLQICPQMIPLTQALALFLHPGYPKWESSELAQRMVQNLALYWNHTADLLADVDADEEQGYIINLHERDEDQPIKLSMSQWCHGFMRSTELWPEAWKGAQARPDLKPHFDILHAWAEPGEPPSGTPYPPGDPEGTITDAALALYRALAPERASEAEDGSVD